MKNRNRSTAAAYAAGLGLSVLFFSATSGRMGGAQAQNDQLLGSQPTVEPAKGDAGPPATEGTMASQTPETVIRIWPEAARSTARAMIGKYGEPTRWSEGALVWIANGPWERTVVYRSAWPHFIGKRDKDYLEQTIAYRVPSEKIDQLRRFDRRIEVNTARGHLSARSESEAMNFLALNLADEIVTDKRSVEDARDFYMKTERLSKAGKSSAYMDGLMFPSPNDGERPRP
jgi:hypothetical protein